jgi:mannose-6-phosphate isomerase-like protein (cupin superfamily)
MPALSDATSASALGPVRRIVTGHDPSGRAVIASEGPPPTVFALEAVPGTVFHEIWATDTVPARIDNGADPTVGELRLAPPRGGTRIRVVDIPPDTVQNAISREAAAAAFAEIAASDAHGREGPHALMHRTESVDYGIVLAGEVWLVVDDGETRLQPGDVVVQRGTNHAWSNRTEETARMAFVLVDGAFAEELRQPVGGEDE